MPVKKDKLTLMWIYKESKHVLGYILLLTILGMLLSVCGVSFALVSKNVLDVATRSINGNVIKSFTNLAVLIVIQLSLQILFSTVNVRVIGKLNISIRKRLFENLLIKNYSSISNYHSGELVNRLNSDVSFITNAVVEIIPNGISYITRIALSFTALFVLEPMFALIFLVLGPIILSVSHIYRKKMKKLYKKCQESDGKTRSFMQECLQNLLVVKSFGNEDIITKHSTNLQIENYRYTLKRNNISIIANILFYVAVTIGYYFALAWGAYRLSQGLMSFGTLTAILQLVGQVQTPFRNISSIIPQYFSMFAAAERLIEINSLSDEKDLNERNIDCQYVYSEMSEIVLKNVSFAYSDNNILESTDLNIKKGEFIAISGDSGIGKSTLLKLLLGIILPTSGDAYIKLNTGEKFALDRNTRGIFAYVPQGNMVLSGTIRDNISFSNDSADDEYIIKCAKIAEIWEFIDSLPNKFDTIIGEKGLGLSEGQIQRLAIARAIYYNAPIILLDEATSALDEKTEAKLLRNLRRLEDKSCIIVSHRKEAFKICDKSVCVKNGKFELFTYK